MEQPDTIQVHTTTVGCDGGGGSLGHPKVYLKIDEDGEVVCPYCSRRFVLATGAATGTGH